MWKPGLVWERVNKANTVISNKLNLNSYLNLHKTIPVITISKNKIPGLKMKS